MGYRCIRCKKDFGSDKKALESHLLICTGLTENEIVKSVEENSESITTDIVMNSLFADIAVNGLLKEILEK